MQMLFGNINRLKMSAPRDELSFLLLLIAHAVFQVLLQQINAFARDGRHVYMCYVFYLFAARSLFKQIYFIVHTGKFAGGGQWLRNRVVVFQARIDKIQHTIGAFDFCVRTTNAFLFHAISAIAQTRGINNVQRQAINLYVFAQHITCGTGDFSDDRSVVSRQRIEQTGFACIRSSCNHHGHSIFEQTTLLRRLFYRLQLLLHLVEFLRDGPVCQKIDFFFGKIQCGFDMNTQLCQVRYQRVDLFRKSTLQRMHRGFCRLLTSAAIRSAMASA